MRSITLLFFLFMTLVQTNAQRLHWAKGLIGTGVSTIDNLSPGSNICRGIAVDGNKNIYIAGTQNDSVDFDPGTNQFYQDGGNDDVYIAKYDSAGQRIWSHVFATNAGWNYATALVIDDQSNVYVAGYCNTAADFDPSPATYTLPVNVTGAYSFIAKYSTDGNFIWAIDIGGVSASLLFDMSIDSLNRIYVTGNFYNVMDCDPSPAQALISSSGSGVFFACYDENGNYLMAKSISGVGMYGGASGVYSDNTGSVYVTGFFGGTVDFDPGSGVYNLSATSSAERFFAKYDLSGNFIWARNIDTHENVLSSGRMIKLTTNSNNDIYLTGQYTGLVDFDAGPGTYMMHGGNYTSGFIAKYDSAGNFLQAISLSGSCFPTDILCDCSDNIFVTGDFSRADFDPGPDDHTITSNAPSAFQIFFAKYNPELEFRWARNFGNDGYGGSINGRPKIVLDSEEDQYIGGGFKQTADFDPDSATFTLTQGGVGMNTFFAKFRASISADNIEANISCANSESHFSIVDSNFIDGVQWNYGDGSMPDSGNAVSHVFSSAGTYLISAYIQTSCTIDTISSEIEITGEPQIDIVDHEICFGETYRLSAETNNGTYIWQDGSALPYFDVNSAGTYWVAVTVNNCTAIDTAIIDTSDCSTVLEMPNVFTPNRDGKNDSFIPKEIKNISNATLEIFNRWGNKILQTTEIRSGWDGKYSDQLCPSGTYYWIINYTDNSGNKAEKKGIVTLLSE